MMTSRVITQDTVKMLGTLMRLSRIALPRMTLGVQRQSLMTPEAGCMVGVEDEMTSGVTTSKLSASILNGVGRVGWWIGNNLTK